MSDVTSIIAVVVAMFFAMNIGASGTAAAMGEPYGGGALKRRRTALILVALFAFAGAALGGGNVSTTIGQGLINTTSMLPELVLVTLAAACVTLFAANLLGIPLSTSEVTVGAIVGVGIAFNGVYFGKVLLVVLSWVAVPALAFAVVVLGKRFVVPIAEAYLAARPDQVRGRRALCGLLILAGCYQAFAAGMNNVANAVGPLVSAQLLDMTLALVLAGVALSAGAFTLGGRVLETNAKRITKLSLFDATLVALTGGTLVVLASLAGIPVPLTQTTTLGIIGIGFAKGRTDALDRQVVRRIVWVWVLSPFASFFLALGATTWVLGTSTVRDWALACAWIVTALVLLLVQRTMPGLRRQVAPR